MWNSIATWGNVRVPGPNDTVAIGSPFTVTLNLTTTIAKLIVDNGGNFNTSTYTLTVTGGFVLDGTWTGAGTISLTTSSDSLYGSGSMTGTSILEIAGTNKAIASTANLQLKQVSILSGETLNNKGIVTIDSLTGAAANSSFVNFPGSTLTINGPLLATGTFDAGTCPNTVIFNGTILQTVKQATYCNIIISGAGAKVINNGATITAHGDVTQQSGTPFTVGVITFQIDGGLITGDNFVNNGDINIGN
jgi:hypothetical protein